LAAFDYGLQAEAAERKAAEAFTASKPADSLAAAAIASQAAERAATAQRTADDALQRLRQLSKADLPSMLDQADRAQGSAQSADIELGRDLKMLEAATTAAAGLTNGLYVQSIRPALRGLGTNSVILVHLALEQGRRSLATAHAAATASATGRSNVASAMTRSLTPVILVLVDSAIAGATLAKSTFVSVLPDGASLDEGERILHRGMKQLRLAEMEMQTIDQLATSVGDETEKPAVDRSRKLVSEARHAVLPAVETLAKGIVEAARRSLEEMRKSDAVPAKSAGLEVALEYAAARGHEARRFHEFEDRFEKVLGDRTSDSLAEARRRLTRIVEEVAAEVGKANLPVRALLREESVRLASQAADEASKDRREWNRGQLVEYTARLNGLSERNATLQKLADQHPAIEPDEGSADSVIRATQKSFNRHLQEGAGQIAKIDEETRTKTEAAEKERQRLAEEAKSKLAPGVLAEAGSRVQLGRIGVRWIPAGRFTMGSPSGEDNRDSDEVRHEVALTRGFFLAETECTQGQWEAVMVSNPSNFKGGDRPVEQVSWEEAVEYCRKLTAQERAVGSLPEGWEWRLPTEAEWEYAARAGTTGARYGEMDAIAWYGGNSGNTTHAVKGKQANAWGLYDMMGNVWEWCSDWSGAYPTGSVTDPTGPSSGSLRVVRGGSWVNVARSARSADRDRNDPGDRGSSLGFRPALSAVQ
jgi:formylglycine-generating enzyme required for sulfatase activity